MTIAAVILAGGQGRRMGYVNKAHLTLDGERFIDRQLRLAGEWADERIVVVNDPSRADELTLPDDVRVILDRYAGEGPLAGLHAGLQEVSKPFAWVIGCDQPLIDANAARFLLGRMQEGEYQAALPIIDGRPQPLHAIYRKETSGIADRLLASGNRRLISLLDEIAWIGIAEREFGSMGLSARFADDIDTPEQNDRLRS